MSLNGGTSSIESIEDTVRDTYCSLEQKVNLLNIEVKPFIEDQMLVPRQSRKDCTFKAKISQI